MMIDLDTSRVLSKNRSWSTGLDRSPSDERFMPSVIDFFLKEALQFIANTTAPQTASQNALLSEAFLEIFVEICGHYNKYIVTQEDGTKVFKVCSRTLSLEGTVI
jgi:hypothetical protein